MNRKNKIKELTYDYQNRDTNQISICGGYVKVRESLYSQVIFWLNIILSHIVTMTILPKYEGSHIKRNLEWLKTKSCELSKGICLGEVRIIARLLCQGTLCALESILILMPTCIPCTMKAQKEGLPIYI